MCETIKIGNGRFREVYAVGHMAVKKIKDAVKTDNKRYMLREAFIREFDIDDINKEEFNKFLNINKTLCLNNDNFMNYINERKYFNEIFGYSIDSNISFSALVRDFDNKISKTLEFYLSFRNVPDNFFNELDRLDSIIKRYDLGIDINSLESSDILVKRIDDGRAHPVLVDYKAFFLNQYFI